MKVFVLVNRRFFKKICQIQSFPKARFHKTEEPICISLNKLFRASSQWLSIAFLYVAFTENTHSVTRDYSLSVDGGTIQVIVTPTSLRPITKR